MHLNGKSKQKPIESLCRSNGISMFCAREHEPPGVHLHFSLAGHVTRLCEMIYMAVEAMLGIPKHYAWHDLITEKNKNVYQIQFYRGFYPTTLESPSCSLLSLKSEFSRELPEKLRKRIFGNFLANKMCEENLCELFHITIDSTQTGRRF